ncbi:MAG: hypothetical protein LUQ09_05885 [Methanomassiliicoccales archaeon]|nr:hypothetical protein [Methanomassiliicoccales archaeon]
MRLAESDIRQALLRYLRQVYPARMDPKDVISNVASAGNFDNIEVCRVLDRLRTEGLVEETLYNSGAADSRRVQINQAGLGILQAEDQTGGSAEVISPREIESKLISTYDNMKTDMEELRRNLNSTQKELGKVMGELHASISDHDQFLKTYFVRIMESISVFIGIFGIVVVIMVSSLSGHIREYFTYNEFVVFIIVLPVLLIITIVPTLLLIKRYILDYSS